MTTQIKVLITGVTGFVGSHLVDYLLEHQLGVVILGTRRATSKTDNIQKNLSSIRLIDCDMTDADMLAGLIEHERPDRIFHLAAQSFVPASWASPRETFRINIIGQCNLFEAVRKITKGSYRPVIQIAGSSEEYGLVSSSEGPIREDYPLRPLSPYAVSKVAQDFMGYQYFKSYGLRIIRTRAFNHSGPRRREDFVDSNFAKQIALIEAGRRAPVIEVGNLEAIRDFTDVRDLVAAYWVATERCQAGEVYNIASGTGYRIQSVLDTLIGYSTVKGIEVRKDPKRMRPSDVPVLVGDASKFRQSTGWSPNIHYLRTTLLDTLNYWRENCGSTHSSS